MVHAVQNVHTFETSRDWDEENISEEDKERASFLNKEAENFENNTEDTEGRSHLLEETLVVEKREEEEEVNISKEKNFLKKKKENFPEDEEENFPKEKDENYSNEENDTLSNRNEKWLEIEDRKSIHYKQRWVKSKIEYVFGIIIHWLVNILLLCPILITGKIGN